MRIIIIGAGVVGSSLAWRLAQAGIAVTVLEADHIGAGTSGATFAWLNSNNKPPRHYHDLNVAGMRGHAVVQQELGDSSWWHGGGNLEWFHDAGRREAQRRKVEQLRAWDYAAEWLTPAQLHEMEPDIDPAAVGDAPVAFYPEEGWIDPVLYARAVLDAAQRAGATLRCGVRVTALVRTGGRVTGVRADGEVVQADVVVNCTGIWVNSVADGDLAVPLAPTPGLLVMTSPAPTRVWRIIHAPGCHFRPDGGGRLMLHSAEIDHALPVGVTATPHMPQARALLDSATGVVPGLAGVPVEAVRLGMRPIPADGYPAVGPLSGVEGYYVVVSHSAVTLAPVLAEAAANELARGRSDLRLEPYRPGRFVRA